MSWDALGWYLSIFAWLYFTGLGIPPCPEEAGILYAATVTALHADVHWYLSWPATSAGIACADVSLYWIGRRWGRRLFEYRWVQRIIKPERRQRLEEKFHEHGTKILLMARFLPPLRTGVFVTAGAVRFSFLRFVLADVSYCIVGVGVLFFGGTWLIGLIHYIGHWVAYAAVVVGISYALYRYYRYLRERERRGNAPLVSVLELAPGATPPPTKETAPPLSR